jgi:hypothetical protein
LANPTCPLFESGFNLFFFKPQHLNSFQTINALHDIKSHLKAVEKYSRALSHSDTSKHTSPNRWYSESTSW